MPNYTRNWMRTGGLEPADIAGGGSDRLVDSLVAWGDGPAGGAGVTRPRGGAAPPPSACSLPAPRPGCARPGPRLPLSCRRQPVVEPWSPGWLAVVGGEPLPGRVGLLGADELPHGETPAVRGSGQLAIVGLEGQRPARAPPEARAALDLQPRPVAIDADERVDQVMHDPGHVLGQPGEERLDLGVPGGDR